MQRFLQEIMKKNNTWNIRRLVDESFVPATQRPSVLHWRLSDFLSLFSSPSRHHVYQLFTWVLCSVNVIFHAIHISNNDVPIPFPIRNYCHCTPTTNLFPLTDTSGFSFLPDIYHKEGEKCLLASIMYTKYSKHLSSGIQNGLWLR